MVRYSAVLLLLLTAGCASVTPEPTVSQPKAIATQPDAPQPAATQPAATQPVATQPAAPPAAGRSAPPVARTPAPVARTPAPVAPAPKPAASSVAAAPAPVAAAPLDMKALEARLRATKAIGVFTKISLKNKVDDLMKQFRGHYQGKTTPNMTELRRSYDLLMMKVLSLVQDADQPLATAIFSSREAIWGLLSDQKKFDALQI